MRSICEAQKEQIEDAHFYQRVSARHRKSKMQMQLYMTDRLKSICKFKEKQVADTSVSKKASATANITPVQIQRLPQRYLYKQITPGYRYIRRQKATTPTSSSFQYLLSIYSLPVPLYGFRKLLYTDFVRIWREFQKQLESLYLR